MNYKHGCTYISERNASNPRWKAHYTWLGMKSRCNNPKNKQYADWGGRGITYDPSWQDFEVFIRDMGLPSSGTTLDRKNNDGNYCKENCQWATRAVQNRNKRSNRYLEFNGERHLVVEWAEILGVKHRLLRVRLNRGWSVERTLATPVQAVA